MSYAIPLSSQSAPVDEYVILWTADKYKKLKKWHDGYLRYHTFNKRLMVYDHLMNKVCDKFLPEEEPLEVGDELTFDSHLCTIEEVKGRQEQDLRSLYEKTVDRRNKRGDAPAAGATTAASPSPASMRRAGTVGTPAGRTPSLLRTVQSRSGVITGLESRPYPKTPVIQTRYKEPTPPPAAPAPVVPQKRTAQGQPASQKIVYQPFNVPMLPGGLSGRPVQESDLTEWPQADDVDMQDPEIEEIPAPVPRPVDKAPKAPLRARPNAPPPFKPPVSQTSADTTTTRDKARPNGETVSRLNDQPSDDGRPSWLKSRKFETNLKGKVPSPPRQRLSSPVILDDEHPEVHETAPQKVRPPAVPKVTRPPKFVPPRMASSPDRDPAPIQSQRQPSRQPSIPAAELPPSRNQRQPSKQPSPPALEPLEPEIEDLDLEPVADITVDRPTTVREVRNDLEKPKTLTLPSAVNRNKRRLLCGPMSRGSGSGMLISRPVSTLSILNTFPQDDFVVDEDPEPVKKKATPKAKKSTDKTKPAKEPKAPKPTKEPKAPKEPKKPKESKSKAKKAADAVAGEFDDAVPTSKPKSNKAPQKSTEEPKKALPKNKKAISKEFISTDDEADLEPLETGLKLSAFERNKLLNATGGFDGSKKGSTQVQMSTDGANEKVIEEPNYQEQTLTPHRYKEVDEKLDDPEPLAKKPKSKARSKSPVVQVFSSDAEDSLPIPPTTKSKVTKKKPAPKESPRVESDSDSQPVKQKPRKRLTKKKQPSPSPSPSPVKPSDNDGSSEDDFQTLRLTGIPKHFRDESRNVSLLRKKEQQVRSRQLKAPVIAWTQLARDGMEIDRGSDEEEVPVVQELEEEGSDIPVSWPTSTPLRAPPNEQEEQAEATNTTIQSPKPRLGNENNGPPSSPISVNISPSKLLEREGFQGFESDMDLSADMDDDDHIEDADIQQPQHQKSLTPESRLRMDTSNLEEDDDEYNLSSDIEPGYSTAKFVNPRSRKNNDNDDDDDEDEEYMMSSQIGPEYSTAKFVNQGLQAEAHITSDEEEEGDGPKWPKTGPWTKEACDLFDWRPPNWQFPGW